MQRLVDDARSIFETAAAAPQDGQSPDVAILVDASGSLRIVEGSGWRPEALQAHYGARSVFQVIRAGHGIRVQAREGRDSCVLQSSGPASRLPLPLPSYTVISLPHLLA